MTRNVLLISLIAATAAVAWAADDSIVYISAIEESATEEHAEIDRQVRAVLSSDFTIVEIPDDSNYVKPKAIAGRRPHTALTESGDQIGGKVGSPSFLSVNEPTTVIG